MKPDLTVQESKNQMREVNRYKILELRSKRLNLIKSQLSIFDGQKISQSVITKLNLSQERLYLEKLNDLQHRHFHV